MLKGLLERKPKNRLSASKALRLPIFDSFSYDKGHSSSSTEQTLIDQNMDTIDGKSRVAHTIKSLDKRSVVKKLVTRNSISDVNS